MSSSVGLGVVGVAPTWRLFQAARSAGPALGAGGDQSVDSSFHVKGWTIKSFPWPLHARAVRFDGFD